MVVLRDLPARRWASAPLKTLLARLVLLAAVLATAVASADGGRPLLRGGRERDVLALLRPYADGAEVTPGIVLQHIAIASDRIVLRVADKGGGRGELVLLPQRGSKSFAASQSTAPTAALGAALQALQDAVSRNDDGSFFARDAPATAAPSTPADATGLALASWLAWCVLGLAVLAKALRRPRSWATWLAGGAVLIWAVHARRALPLTLIHADDHGLLEIGVAIGSADAEAATQRLMAQYGPAWWQFQRATVGLFGHDHDAVGRWSAAMAALSVALTAVAARRASGKWLAAAVGTAVMVGAPVAARVGHSESTLVVAQLLVAVTLWLASPPYPPRSARWDAIGAVAALLLLAWGHPLGPLYAIGTGLCAWALGARGPAQAASLHAAPTVATAGAAIDPLPALPGTLGDVAGPHGPRSTAHTASTAAAAASAVPPAVQRWWPSPASLLALGLGGATVAAAIAWQVTSHAGLLGARLDATRNALPIPARFWHFWLWWHGEWGAVVASTVLLLLGCAGLYAQRRVHGRAVAVWTTLAWTAGLVAVAAAGLVVVACITDALRYQAPLAPVLALTLAFAPRAAALLGDRWQLIGRGMVAFAQLLAVLEVARTQAGSAALDSQGQAYQLLRRELADERKPFALIAPERPPGARRHVVVGMPLGPWRAGGPAVSVMSDVAFRQRCLEGQAPAAWLFLPPACEAIDLPEAGTPCAALEPLLDIEGGVRAGYVRPLQPLTATGLRGEFHDFKGDLLGWRLGHARCPTGSGGQAK